ncbi:MAG: D-glycerate dehydrogenase [Planctomycetota bacterium]
MSSKPKVFLTRGLPAPTMRRLESETELIFQDIDRALSRDELLAGVRDADGMICLLSDQIDAELLDAASRLKVVSNYAVGFNNIDVDAATARGIAVTNTPGVLADSTADMAWALLMAAARRVVEGDELVRSGEWEGWEPMQLLGTEVTGATLGIVGLGQIGQAIARRARGFDMNVLYWSRTRRSKNLEQQLQVQYCELDELLGSSDYLSINVALCEDTRHLLSKAEFEQMKPSSIVINTSRGAVIDEQALVEALRQGAIAGAALDVFEHEPQVTPDLRKMPNVVLAPHLGSATDRTRCQMGELAVSNCLAACAGQVPPHLVNKTWHPKD